VHQCLPCKNHHSGAWPDMCGAQDCGWHVTCYVARLMFRFGCGHPFAWQEDGVLNSRLGECSKMNT